MARNWYGSSRRASEPAFGPDCFYQAQMGISGSADSMLASESKGTTSFSLDMSYRDQLRRNGQQSLRQTDMLQLQENSNQERHSNQARCRERDEFPRRRVLSLEFHIQHSASPPRARTVSASDWDESFTVQSFPVADADGCRYIPQPAPLTSNTQGFAMCGQQPSTADRLMEILMPQAGAESQLDGQQIAAQLLAAAPCHYDD